MKKKHLKQIIQDISVVSDNREVQVNFLNNVLHEVDAENEALKVKLATAESMVALAEAGWNYRQAKLENVNGAINSLRAKYE